MIRKTRTRSLARGAVRSRATAVLEEVLESQRRAQGPLEQAGRGLTARDRRLLYELVLGSLRWMRRIDWVLEGAAGRPIKAIDSPVRWPLRVAAYQLLFLDRVPSHAVVDEAVAEVRRRGLGRATGFANAVLRRLASSRSLEAWPVDIEDEARRLGVESSHPDFLVERWLERFGRRRAKDLLEASNTPKPMHLLCFGDRREIAFQLGSEGLETSLDVLSPNGLQVIDGDPLMTESFRQGRFYIQDDASQAAALVPSPRRRERILDLAAAPGGKGFALAAAEPSVRIVAADLSLSRLRRLSGNQRRLGMESPLAAMDARQPAFAPVFDRVVLDLPCSGSGTIARHPELKWRLSSREVGRLAAQGVRMLESAADLVRPGGLLCAITCSLEEEENEQVMAEFLSRKPSFEAFELAGQVSELLAGGLVDRGKWQVLTTASHDGFTVHVAQRRPSV